MEGWLSMVEGSDAVAALAYDPAERQLLVMFTSGETYIYFAVPPDEADAFRRAESKGGFFQAHVRDRYAFQRVEAPQD